MKPIMIIIGVSLVLVGGASAQMKVSPDMEKTFMSMEKQAWDAFGKGDGKFFQDLMTADGVVVGSEGITSKAESVKMISAKPCDVKSYSFNNFKVTMLDPDAALVTYGATVDGTCGTDKLPAKVYASTVLVKRNGKWQAA